MGCIKIFAPGGAELQGHLIEGKTYGRVRDLAKALGFGVKWQPGVVTITEPPRAIRLDTDLRLPSGVTDTLLDKYLTNTPIADLGTYFLAAEYRWRVNAVFACAVACHESNFGRSRIAQDKRNLFGFMAYDLDPYGSAKSYGTYADSIEDFCKLISREYLNPAGAYFNGPNVAGVGQRYATDPRWSDKVLRHCQAIFDLAKE